MTRGDIENLVRFIQFRINLDGFENIVDNDRILCNRIDSLNIEEILCKSNSIVVVSKETDEIKYLLSEKENVFKYKPLLIFRGPLNDQSIMLLEELGYFVNRKPSYSIADYLINSLNQAFLPLDSKAYYIPKWAEKHIHGITLKNWDINKDIHEGERKRCSVCNRLKFSHVPDSLYVKTEPEDFCFTVSFNVIYNKEIRLILGTMNPLPDLNLKWLPFIGANDFVIFNDYGWEYGSNHKIYRQIKEVCPFPENLYFLSNDRTIHQTRLASGLQSYLIHHNAWLNEHFFTIGSRKRIYDAVMNGRISESGYKRQYLASKVGNLALIAERDNYDVLPEGLRCSFISDHKLTPNEVLDLYHQSRVGLILSAMEGGCFTSSEYLLSGLPVVSTFSVGGRDLFYNSQNSIQCEPKEDEIALAVNKLVAINPDRNKIRRDHIELQVSQRNLFFTEVLEKILTNAGIPTRPKDFFNKYFKARSKANHWPYLGFRPYCTLKSEFPGMPDNKRFKVIRKTFISLASMKYD